MKIIFFFLTVCCPLLIRSEPIVLYTEIIRTYCPPPFHYYKSWCYYIVPNVTMDWSSAYRLCHSIDRQTHLAYIAGDDEMLDPLRDILNNRERSKEIKSIWTNTTWGQQKRTVISRQSKRLCRKIELKSNLRSGQVDMLRMPFTNCREKHAVMCRRELPSNVTCRRPWALVYGICYYLDEQVRITQTEEEERDIMQCQAWEGDLFYSTQQEKNVLLPFLTYSLHGLRSGIVLSENFGGISYSFHDLIQQNCSLVSGDVYLGAALAQLKISNATTICPSYHSHTFCRQIQNTTCEPPWFYDDGFCLYYSSQSLVDMGTASIECSQNGGHLLYVSNEEELFRLTHNLVSIAPFFKQRSLAGVWLGLSYRAFSSANNDSEDSFDWQWELNIQPYLDDEWKDYEWRRFFQHRLSPYIVSAGDCAALIVDTKIREPIERTTCHSRRTVVCRKPFGNEVKSFHRKANYKRFARLQNFGELVEGPRKSGNTTLPPSLTITRQIFELLNATTYRLILYLNGSSTLTTNLIFTCKSKGILFHRSIPSDELSSLMKFDIVMNATESEYQVLFNYLRSSNCTNTTTSQCIFLSCIENDPWHYLLPEMQTRLDAVRNHSSTNQRCLIKYNYANLNAQICSVLTEQFRVSDDASMPPLLPASRTNQCIDFGGQCVPDSLILSSSMPFADADLICLAGSICWLQGERCSHHSYCINRVRFPCPASARLINVTCSNPLHECCTSPGPSPDSSLILTSTFNSHSWDILLPIYYFSFHGTSKWDKFFFNSWLRTGSDMSHDFVNDEFLFSCTAVFIEPTLLLMHESCLPTRLTSSDRRSILFSMLKTDETDEYDKVALHVDTYQVYSPLQLVRLAFPHDFLVNKTSKRLHDAKLDKAKIPELYCVLVLNENDVRRIRLVNDFERQFIFDENKSSFSFTNSTRENDVDDDEEWSFAPVVCVLNDDVNDWTIVGVSGKQLKHKCTVFNRMKYCQMNFVYSSTWIY